MVNINSRLIFEFVRCPKRHLCHRIYMGWEYTAKVGVGHVAFLTPFLTPFVHGVWAPPSILVAIATNPSKNIVFKVTNSLMKLQQFQRKLELT